MNIKNLVNDAYAKDISAKERAAKRIVQKNGEYVGSTAPYGYCVEKVNGIYKLIVEPESAKIVRRIFEEYASGDGIQSIIDRLFEDGYIGFRTITNIIMCTVRMERTFISGGILRYVQC